MREIYTRNYSHQPRNYTPPPGYVGNAFTDSESLKHHPPEDDVNGSDDRFSDRHEDSVSEAREVILNELRKADDCETDHDCDGHDGHKDEHEKDDHDEKHPFEELLRSFKGKIGREELIILLVMLLVASEGVGIEVLLLALILIAG